MTGNTRQFIRRLADQAAPVRKLRPPYTRAAAWIGLSVAYIGAILFFMPASHDLSSRLHDPSFIVEQLSGLVTGIAAAHAAFTGVVPGSDRRWAILPLLPLGIWLGSFGPACIHELNQFGIQGLPLHHDPWCVPFIVLLGAVPAVAMVVMLRRGAPLTPRLTAALGGLAAAGLANVGVRVIHPEDVSVTLLVWHVGAVIAMSALAGSAGEYFLNWRSVIGASEKS